MNFQLPSGAVLAAALMQTPPAQGEASVNPQSVSVRDEVYESIIAKDVPLPESSGLSTGSTVINLELPALPEWTLKHEKRFLKLAEIEALGELTEKDKVELEHLSNSRYQLKTPRSGEQVLLEFQQRRVTQELIRALDKYVAFQKTARSAGA